MPLSKKELLLMLMVGLVTLAVRFHCLGVPSMWLDEMVVPLVADHDIPFIIERARSPVDAHPPYYHIFIKQVMNLGKSDAMLRAPSVVAGVLAVLLIYAFGAKFFSRQAGIIAAGLLSINNLHILLSREVRPYAIIILFSLAALYCLFSFMETAKHRWMLYALICDALFAPLQFLTILIIGAQCCVLLAACLGGRVRFRDVSIFAILSFLTFLPAAFFMIHKFGDAMDGSSVAVINNYFSIISRSMLFTDNILMIVLCFVLILFAGYVSWREKDHIVPLLGLYALIPVAPLVLVQYSSYFNPWHISFVMPAVILILSKGILSVSARFKVLNALLVLAYVIFAGSIFYEGRIFDVDGHTGEYKQIAATLSATPIGQIPLPTDFSTIDGADWYARQNGRDLLGPYYAKANPRVSMISFLVFGDYAHYAKDEKDFEARYGNGAAKETYPWGSIRRLPIAAAVDRFEAFPVRASLSAEPRDLYSRITNVTNLTVWPYFGFRAIPYLTDRPARFDYPILLPPASGTVLYKVTFQGFKTENQDTMDILYAFDDDEFQPLVFPGSGLPECVLLKSSKPVTKLVIRCEMTRRSKIPSLTSTNNMVLGISDITVYANPLADERFVSSTLDIRETGIGMPEKSPQGDYRWGYGPQSKFTFSLPSEEKVTLAYEFNNPINNQAVVFKLNGKVLAQHDGLPAQAWLKDTTSGTISFSAVKGQN
jgi:hypothetical protein